MEGDRLLGLGVRLAALFAGMHLFGAVRYHFRRRKRDEQGRIPSARRALGMSFGSILFSRSFYILALWQFHAMGAWNAESVGVSTRVSPLLAFVGGVFEYGLFFLAVGAGLGLFGGLEAYRRATLHVSAIFRPKRRIERWLLVTTLVVTNPFTEELVFRGLLVHQLALLYAPLWVAIVLGCVLNAINHSYQGLALLPFHLLFYLAAVAILYSPLGLVGCFGFHFAGDAVPFFREPSNLRAYREARRRARRAIRQ